MLSPRQISSLIKQWSQQLCMSDATRQPGANGEEADPVPCPPPGLASSQHRELTSPLSSSVTAKQGRPGFYKENS